MQYFNYIINAQYNYYISNKGLLEECNKEENLVVTGGCYCFLSEKNIPVNKRNDTKYFVIMKLNFFYFVILLL